MADRRCPVLYVSVSGLVPRRSAGPPRRALGGGRRLEAAPARTSYHTLDLIIYCIVSRPARPALRRTYHQLPGKQVPIFMAYNIIDIDNYDLIIV